MKSTTVQMDGVANPLDIGVRSGLLWRHPSLVLAGLGSVHRIEFDRPNGSQQPAGILSSFAGTSRWELPGRGPVAFAALPFTPTAPGELLIPEVVVGQDAAGRRWVTITDDQVVADDSVASRVQELVDGLKPSMASRPLRYDISSVVDPEEWKGSVAEATRRIRAGDLKKAVLSRKVQITTDQPIDQTGVLRHLANMFPAAMIFAVDGLLGASPEVLVARDRDMVHAHPLAGSAPRSTDPSIDSHNVAKLLSSEKDRWEHQVTIERLLRTLLPYCSYVDAEPAPSVVTLPNVHHLGTTVEGRLSRPLPSVLELVAALHPTPAVGGEPTEKALELIAVLEREGRGRYAGPVGWVDGSGNGMFAVAIRSAEIVENQAELRAGVGVVADSDPAEELAETRIKFRAMLDAIVQP